jgi:hypothetical protein
MAPNNIEGLSRRQLLRVSGGTAAGVALVGTAAGEHDNGNGRGHRGNDEDGHGDDDGDDHKDDGHGECNYETVGGHGGGEHDEEEHSDPLNQYLLCPDHPHTEAPSGHTMHHVNAAMGGCPGGTGLDSCDVDTENPDIQRINEVWPECTDWPEPTKNIIKESREALTQVYNDVGTLISRGYIPYFDIVIPGATGGVSHWLNPGYIEDSHYEPNPLRPDSIILDNNSWKPIGPMYVAAEEGEVHWRSEEDELMEVRDAWGYESDCGECFPYHPHDGVAGRFAWWYYRQVHEQDAAEGDVMLPCYTAPMMHSWIYPTPDGPHGATSGAPPTKFRPDGPPNRPGYPAPVDPAETELSLDVLPKTVQETAMPDRLTRELEIIDALPQEFLMTTPIAELETLMDDRLGPVGDQLDSTGSLNPTDSLDSVGLLDTIGF